ncbi:MAG TPA: HEAT repeat domain-containing protein [Pirellulales bacterium]|nr:HEAT repeat domain-containing protein [Pirellulales bacterium]
MTILVQGLVSGLGSTVTDRLGALSGATQMWATSNNDTETTVTLTTASDLRALAEKIDFGKVTEIDERGRRLVVLVDPTKLPPPEITDKNAPGFYSQNLADLKSPDPKRCERAVRRFKIAPPKELKEEIAAALLDLLAQSNNARMRIEIVELLPTWLSSEQAVPALIVLLADNDGSVVRAAVESLEPYNDPRAAGPLLGLVEHHGFQVDHALTKMGAAAEPALLEHLDEADEKTCLLIVKVLGKIGTEKSIAPLTQLSKSSNSSRIKNDAEDSIRRIRQR